MNTDTDAGDDRMEKINVRVPESLLTQIDEEWERRGYASKSEAIRDALRDWVDPSATLSEGTLEDLAESREQAERGETMTAEEARELLGLTRGRKDGSFDR
jgi:Arc/MetJ-type ribon-helix-helix transcriptional regulator